MNKIHNVHDDDNGNDDDDDNIHSTFIVEMTESYQKDKKIPKKAFRSWEGTVK